MIEVQRYDYFGLTQNDPYHTPLIALKLFTLWAGKKGIELGRKGAKKGIRQRGQGGKWSGFTAEEKTFGKEGREKMDVTKGWTGYTNRGSPENPHLIVTGGSPGRLRTKKNSKGKRWWGSIQKILFRNMRGPHTVLVSKKGKNWKWVFEGGKARESRRGGWKQKVQKKKIKSGRWSKTKNKINPRVKGGC